MTSYASSTGAAVAFHDVVKVYGTGARALDRVSFEIPRGETVALLGPNGAGKTTAIDTMLGLRRQSSGTVHVLGGSPAAAVAAGRVSGMLQTGGLPEGATVGELASLFRQLYRDPRSQAELLSLAGISDLAGRRVERLSGGQTQRVRFALALAGQPDLLFLDEPTVALDVEARRNFWQSVEAITERGTTVLFATHYLEEADTHADRIIVLNRGTVIADGSPSQIKAYTSARTIRFTTAEPDPSEFLMLPGVTDVRVDSTAVTIRSADADATLPALYALGRPIRAMEVGSGGLEEALLAMTTDDNGAGEPAITEKVA